MTLAYTSAHKELHYVDRAGWLRAAVLGANDGIVSVSSLIVGVAAADPGPTQALEAAGSGPRLALLYGRFSGLARPYLAYGAYRADVILRESVVVGLVGATGLGSQLLEALSGFAWDQLAALLLAYALLTLLGETLSDRLRQRLNRQR